MEGRTPPRKAVKRTPRRITKAREEINIRKYIAGVSVTSFVAFLLAVGVMSMFFQAVDRDMIMYVAAALSSIAGTATGYYFGYNNAMKQQEIIKSPSDEK